MSLHPSLSHHWSTLQPRLNEIPRWTDFYQQLATDEQQQWQRVLCHSDYVVDSLAREPDYFLNPQHSLLTLIDPTWLMEQCQWQPSATTDLDHWMSRLRQLRRRAMVHIIAADINRHQSMLEITRALSDLADHCINLAIDIASEWLQRRYGQPRSQYDQSAQKLLVIAMGKLGARELNLSSDIDLIFAYPMSGMTDGEKSISNQEFFIKVGQKVIQLLDKQTIDGFVFRTDMRLRPNGDSGPLVLNFASLQDYYQTQGRDWERFAMVKARLVNDQDREITNQLQGILQPFTFRQYIDFSALESLRSMKTMIQTEVRRRGLEDNIKLGSGGIREVEFIVQAFQLIRGGQDSQLQQPSLKVTLDYLISDQQLPYATGESLWQAYVFLRNAEHAIQAIRDNQTQQLPHDNLDRLRLAISAGCADWPAFYQQLEAHQQCVNQHFNELIKEEANDPNDDRDHSLWQAWWQGQFSFNDESEAGSNDSDNTPAILEVVQPHDWQLVKSVEYDLDQFRQQRSVSRMQPISRQRLDNVMPQIIRHLWQTPKPLTTLKRLLPLLENILRRSSYLALLNENPKALRELVNLAGASLWIADYIAQNPLLLDELIEPASLQKMPSRTELNNDLQVRLLRVDSGDLETQMETLRQFVHAHKLRAAAGEVQQAHHLTQTSTYLSDIAEVSVSMVMNLAWWQMVSRYGYPTDEHGEAVTEAQFSVLGYGKLGGVELSYQSDLDMVFCHSGYYKGATNGERSIENSVFYTRMGQRMIHILGTQTRSGIMYEVDLRLRPSGASGMIVASFKAYQEYQRNHAWTWEHQALVRARFICGSYQLGQDFQILRREILTKPRELEVLQQEVRAMREKMRDNLGTNDSSGQRFHLKQDTGGIVDIEFLVQYWVLSWAQQHSVLLNSTDNLGLLEALADLGLISSAECNELQQGYLSYRTETHRRALHKQPLVIETAPDEAMVFEHHRQAIIECWQRWLENTFNLSE